MRASCSKNYYVKRSRLNRFELHYQPMYEINGKKLIGFEALVRLPGPDGALIPPATFIPVAEEMRLIDRIGKWVLREACQTAKTWPSNLTAAVNLSPAEFESGVIVEMSQLHSRTPGWTHSDSNWR